MKLKKMITVAMLIALSAVGAFIKIPAPVTTVSLDALPGFVAAGLFAPYIGGVAGAAGHLISGLISGFPMGLPNHLLIAGMMFIAMLVFGLAYRVNPILGLVVGIVMNGPVALIPFAFILGWGFFTGMLLPLVIASAVNVVLAVLIIPLLKKALKL